MQMIVRKLDHTGCEVFAYPGQVLARSTQWVVLATSWDRPPMDLGYVVLEPGDHWLETFYTDRWYNIFEIRARDGRLKGWYCNITRPAQITDAEVRAEDLALDLWVDSQGRATVLDEKEFAALSLSLQERTAARAAVEALLEMVAQGQPPFGVRPGPAQVAQGHIPPGAGGAGPPQAAGNSYEPPGIQLEAMVERRLRERGLTLAVAESCTGGLVSHCITDIPGSSDVYRGAVVAYANDIKQRLLGVERRTLEEHGAVSAQTARQMAQGVRRLLAADLGLAVTGIAGPGGGSPEKPVGLVYVALAAPDGEWVEQHLWQGDRQANKAASAQAALDLLWRYLEQRIQQDA